MIFIPKCIDCKALDFGFTENDCFPHCSIKHSRDLCKKQHEITKEEAYQEIKCSDFVFEKKEDPEFMFKIDLNSEMYRRELEKADLLIESLEEEAEKKGIRVKNVSNKSTSLDKHSSVLSKTIFKDTKAKIRKILKNYKKHDWVDFTVEEFIEESTQYNIDNYLSNHIEDNSSTQDYIDSLLAKKTVLLESLSNTMRAHLLTDFLDLNIESCSECKVPINPISKKCPVCGKNKKK